MGKAIETELDYIERGPCGCPVPYHTYWDLLCNQLFGQFTPGISESETFDEVKIWHEGIITRTSDESPYTFTMVVEGDVAPKASDVLLYQRKYYIIGVVSDTPDPQTFDCVNCILIDLSIVGVYAALIALEQAATAAEGGRITAEDGRVEAESGRVLAEDGRVSAESQRVTDFSASQNARSLAYLASEGTENGSIAGDGSRWGSFKAAEAERDASLSGYVAALMAPWVVPGVIVEGVFVSDDEEDTPAEAKTRWDAGFRTYLAIRGGKTEEIIAIDEDYLYTYSGCKWKYTED